MKKNQYWYFASNDRKLRFGDGRDVKQGVTHKVDCKPVLCKCGLHASKKILDALSYAPGNTCCLVELSGDIVHGTDKSSATSRKYIKIIDAENLLFEFSRKQTLKVIHLWDAPPIVKEFLETGSPSIRAAAWDAAWVVARAAAWVAAGGAAGAAAWDAAWDAANMELENMMLKEMGLK